MSLLKLKWGRSSDPHCTHTVIGDYKSIFELWHNLVNGTFSDGCSPVGIVVSNLNGDIVDLSQGLGYAASMGTSLH